MKALLKISLVLTLVLSAVFAYAEDDTFALKVKSSNEKSVTFFVTQAQDVDFSIYNSTYDVVYRQTIHADKPAARTYNLEAFPDGSYLFKLETNLQITEYEVVIADGKTSISKPVRTEKLKPNIKKENSMVTFSMDNVGNGPVEVKILNEYNEQLYSKVFVDKSKLSKKFNVGQTDAKELTFIVRYKDQEYVETLALN